MLGTQHIAIREDLWPVVVYTISDNSTDDEWIAMFTHYTACYRRAVRFCPITDATPVTKVISASTRHMIAKLAKEHETQSKRWILESTVVVRNGVIRGAMTAINWLAPPAYPIAFVATLPEAFAHAVASLERDGRDVPAAVRRLAVPPR